MKPDGPSPSITRITPAIGGGRARAASAHVALSTRLGSSLSRRSCPDDAIVGLLAARAVGDPRLSPVEAEATAVGSVAVPPVRNLDPGFLLAACVASGRDVEVAPESFQPWKVCKLGCAFRFDLDWVVGNALSLALHVGSLLGRKFGQLLPAVCCPCRLRLNAPVGAFWLVGVDHDHECSTDFDPLVIGTSRA